MLFAVPTRLYWHNAVINVSHQKASLNLGAPWALHDSHYSHSPINEAMQDSLLQTKSTLQGKLYHQAGH